MSANEPYLRWHPVTGGYVGKSELCVIASRVPDSDCYRELNRLTMERIHEEALEEEFERLFVKAFNECHASWIEKGLISEAVKTTGQSAVRKTVVVGSTPTAASNECG